MDAAFILIDTTHTPAEVEREVASALGFVGDEPVDHVVLSVDTSDFVDEAIEYSRYNVAIELASDDVGARKRMAMKAFDVLRKSGAHRRILATDELYEVLAEHP